MNGIVYIGGPYRAKSEWQVLQNIRRAERVGLTWAKKGHAVLIPHKAFAFMGGALPDAYFIEADLAFLAKCDAMVVLPGWRKSAGTLGEIAFAREHGIQLYHPDGTTFHP